MLLQSYFFGSDYKIASYKKAHCYVRDNQYNKALKYSKNVIYINPKYADTWRVKFKLLCGSTSSRRIREIRKKLRGRRKPLSLNESNDLPPGKRAV